MIQLLAGTAQNERGNQNGQLEILSCFCCHSKYAMSLIFSPEQVEHFVMKGEMESFCLALYLFYLKDTGDESLLLLKIHLSKA